MTTRSDLDDQVLEARKARERLANAADQLLALAEDRDDPGGGGGFILHHAQLLRDIKDVQRELSEALAVCRAIPDPTDDTVRTLVASLGTLVERAERLAAAARDAINDRSAAPPAGSASRGATRTPPGMATAAAAAGSGIRGPGDDGPQVSLIIVKPIVQRGEPVYAVARVHPHRQGCVYRWDLDAAEVPRGRIAVADGMVRIDMQEKGLALGRHTVRVTVECSGREAWAEAEVTVVDSRSEPPPTADEAQQIALRFKANVDDHLSDVAGALGGVSSAIDRAASAEVRVRLERTTPPWAESLIVVSLVQEASERFRFRRFAAALDARLCGQRGDIFRDLNAYDLLVRWTDAYLQANAVGQVDIAVLARAFQHQQPTAAQMGAAVNRYLNQALPYLDEVAARLGGTHGCQNVIPERLMAPVMLELIWSYWHEAGYLAQGLKAISLRFQNRRSPHLPNPLAQFAVDPLRRLGNLLWGYIQDEQHRLTVHRRAYEYSHAYDLPLTGRAVGQLDPVDARVSFIGAFHTLLNVCAAYFRQLDDNTVTPDTFPVLNALRDLHRILAEGAHNQYGDLPWVARREMLIEQYLLARPEMREFLGGKPMVPYAEGWMDRADTVNRLQGWTDVSVTHFNALAVFGEQLLLTVRFFQWADPAVDAVAAGAWAVAMRQAIQEYIHSYRAVTGTDLSARTVALATPPSFRTRRMQRRPGAV